MKMNWFLIASGKMTIQSTTADWPKATTDNHAEYWGDVAEAEPGELREFLGRLRLHPLLLDRCIDRAISPGVLVHENSVLMEYPAAFDRQLAEPTYLTILLQTPYLVTVRHGTLGVLDEFIAEACAEHAPQVYHLPQIIYQILDNFTDLNVDAQTNIRDQILGMAKTLADTPDAFDASGLSRLRWQVGNLISLVENQLYCASSLAALDLKDLQEPHRKAYVQDLVAEAEITQRAVYRLEARLNNLYSDYQMVGSDRVEKRLRLLTIVFSDNSAAWSDCGLAGYECGWYSGDR
jgi:Mg2+ and Co2+ transporter CorA